MLRRMGLLVAVVITGACDKGARKANPPPACDPAKVPATEWANQQYEAAKTHADQAYSLQDLSVRTTSIVGLYEVSAHPCCDIPVETLGDVFNCKFYRKPQEAAHDVLLAKGWAAAGVSERMTLAISVDEALGQVLETQPSKWDPAKNFHPPIAQPAADGGVTLTRWIDLTVCGQSCKYDYALVEQTVAADAWFQPLKVLDRSYP